MKTGHKTRYFLVDHLIKAHDKVPNEIGELDFPVPELGEQSNLGIDYRPGSTSVPQPPVHFADKDCEPNASVNEEHVNTPSPVVLRQSERVKTCCPIELVANVIVNMVSLVVRMFFFSGEAV